MPRVDLGLQDFSKVKGKAGFDNYVGPTPPKGVYRCITKLWKLAVGGDDEHPMFKIIFEIHEPKGSKKAKFNGYAIWYNANLNKKGAEYVNGMADALGISAKAIWASKIVLAKDEENVISIGGKKVIGIETMIAASLGKEYKGERNLQVTKFLGESEDDEADDDSDDDDIDSDDTDDDDDDDSDDDEDDSDDDDEDDEDDEPPAKSKSKSTKAKPAAKKKRRPAEDDDDDDDEDDDEDSF